jgi:hypothetical protein
MAPCDVARNLCLTLPTVVAHHAESLAARGVGKRRVAGTPHSPPLSPPPYLSPGLSETKGLTACSLLQLSQGRQLDAASVQGYTGRP